MRDPSAFQVTERGERSDLRARYERYTPNFGEQIVGELVKSYGFKQDRRSGEWSWSGENIAQAFSDSPFWTTVDYLTIAVPVARWGVAAGTVLRGATTVGRAYQAGAFGASGVKALGKAARAQIKAPAQTRFGRYFQSPVGIEDSDQYMRWLKKYPGTEGLSAGDQRFVTTMLQRDRAAEIASIGRRVSDVQRLTSALDGTVRTRIESLGGRELTQRELVDEALRFSPQGTDAEKATLAELRRAMGKGGEAAFDRLAEFRDRLHTEAFELGLFGRETAERNLQRYKPQLYRDLLGMGADTAPGGGFRPRGLKGGGAAKAGEARFAKRRYTAEEVDEGELFGGRLLDPDVTAAELGNAAMVVAQQRFALNLGRSLATKSGDEVMRFFGTAENATAQGWKRVADLFPGKPPARASARLTALIGERAKLQGELKRQSKDWERVREIFDEADLKLSQREGRQVEKLSFGTPPTQGDIAEAGARFERLSRGGKRALTQKEMAAVEKLLLGEEYLPGTVKGARVRQILTDTRAERGRLGAAGADSSAVLDPLNPEIDPRSLLGKLEQIQQRRGAQLLRRDLKLAVRIAEQEAKDARPAFLRRMPADVLDRWVDPAVQEDFAGLMRVDQPGTLRKVYDGIQTAFKVSKTAYNPATQVRNFFGNVLFHSATVGFPNGLPVTFSGPRRGWAALRRYNKGQPAAGEDYVRMAIDAGVLNSDFLAGDTQRNLLRAYGDAFKKGEGWISSLIADQRWPKAVRAVARGAEKFDESVRRAYTFSDEVWKLDAFAWRYDAAMKAGANKGPSIAMRDAMKKLADLEELNPGADVLGGLSRERWLSKEARNQAIARASSDVFQYNPSYLQTSPFTSMLRQHLPFSSFATETARVWKNMMVFKPHVALFWNNFAMSASEAGQALAGMSDGEVENARSALPWYTEGKKMALLPWRDTDGKPHFIDLSYIIPGASLGAEAQQAGEGFLGQTLAAASTLGIGPDQNPMVQILGALATGVDPFTQRPIEPKFFEQQAGLYLDSTGQRRALGLLEHTARVMLPPLVPPGYAGTNIVEAIRGTKSGATGRPLEESAVRAILTNFAGIRTYEPTVQAQVLNVRREQRVTGQAVEWLWNRWEFAAANRDTAEMERARKAIIKEKGADFFEKNRKQHTPGSFQNLSKRTVEEVLARSGRFRATPDERAAVYARFLETRSQ